MVAAAAALLLAAGLLVDLYAHDLTPAQHHLTVIFAFFFIPQIFFYGVSSLAGYWPMNAWKRRADSA